MSAGFYFRPQIVKQIRQSARAVIEASAGTGKTFLIEHLLIDLLLSGDCTVDQILVVTFTEKATAELRVRLRKALAAIVLGAPETEPAGGAEPVAIDQPMRERVEKALRGFDSAPIFTIHGFCHRVLTDFAFQSGTLLDLQLTDARGAFHRAFRSELRDHLAVDGITRPLLEKWLTGSGPEQPEGKSPDELESLLFDAYSRRYLGSRDRDWRVKAAETLLSGYDAKLLERDFRRCGLESEALDRSLAVVGELKLDIEDARGSGEALLEILAGIDLAPLIDPIRYPDKRRNLTFSKAAKSLAVKVEAADIAAKSHQWKLIDLFLPPVAERLKREKKEHGLIDYEDMLAWVADALDGAGADALTRALRDRFRCALVDEFQDTDDLQWRIFRRLFAQSDTNRLYVVGDPKQAIYAFRGADVFTYLKARAELTAAREAIPLVDNFRSTSSLIDALNHVLDQKAQPPLFKGEIDYRNPVRCGREDRKAILNGEPITPVALMRYEGSHEKGAPVSEIRLALGRHIAAQLHRILNEDAHRIRIEEKGRSPRVVGPEGIFVLTRTRQESVEIGNYLAQAGVPFKFYKQDGLFQTPEATHVLDVLCAIAQPHLRSNRLKAWVSPFFAVPLRELALIGEVRPGHALNERLYEWKAIAEQGRFARLFDSLLHESGVAARELFLTGSERRLTNYQHIFELLLTAATARRLDLDEIITLLDDYIAERAQPEGEDANTQRLESERDAVSVITVHMSKGLEADVVVLFGGFGRIPDRSAVAVYHDQSRERRFAIGKAAQDLVRDQLNQEREEEDARLLYVGLTRARARLYLPLLPATRMKLGGYYAALNARLLKLEGQLRDRKLRKLFELQNVAEPSQEEGDGGDLSARLREWKVPPDLTVEPKGVESEGTLWNLRRSRAPLVMRSYTSMRRAEEDRRWDIPADEFKRDLESPSMESDLPGGREVGIFLHEVIERVPTESFSDSYDMWRRREDVKALFHAAMRRHQVEPSWFERGTQIVFDLLTTPLELPGHKLKPLCQCHSAREMEFVYPIPESSHPLLASASTQGRWTVERGYLKGFVDLVFEDGDLVYFADWKSDHLPNYEPAAIEEHVAKHYRLQAQIYSIGVLRLLQIRNQQDYQARFGGLLYVFLRGIGRDGSRGVYFHRPSWDEIRGYESELMREGYEEALQP